jgi:hypothetical protein
MVHQLLLEPTRRQDHSRNNILKKGQHSTVRSLDAVSFLKAESMPLRKVKGISFMRGARPRCLRFPICFSALGGLGVVPVDAKISVKLQDSYLDEKSRGCTNISA